jgi:hypothetical protein
VGGPHRRARGPSLRLHVPGLSSRVPPTIIIANTGSRLAILGTSHRELLGAIIKAQQAARRWPYLAWST